LLAALTHLAYGSSADYFVCPSLQKMAFGDYPAEYNPKIHGPYDPARYYGTRKYI